MSDPPRTPFTGRKPIRKHPVTPSQPLDVSVPLPTDTPAGSPINGTKPKPRTRSSTNQPTPALQTRASNKEKHPGLAQKALDMVRRSSEAVQAEKDQKKAAAEAAENKRVEARDRLVIFEDDVQRAQDDYKRTFARPSVDSSGKDQHNQAIPENGNPLEITGSPAEREGNVGGNSRRAQLLSERARLDRLRKFLVATLAAKKVLSTHWCDPVWHRTVQGVQDDVDDGDHALTNGEEPDSTERLDTQDQERPSEACEPELEGEKTLNKQAKKKKTTRTEVTHERKIFASTPIITANDPPTPVSSKKRKSNAQNSSKLPSKKAKTPTNASASNPPVKTGLKARKQKTKPAIVNSTDESMLQEGKSVGFEDNKTADQQERVSTKSAIPVKIQPKPLELAVGREARSDGKSKFSGRHLPDFIRENDGDRKILYPMAKEALGHVHSWGIIKRSTVQLIVDRGWGPGRVVIPEVGKNAVSGLIDARASDLRHEMSTAALTAVQEFINEHSTTAPPPQDPEEEEGWVFRDAQSRAEFAQYMTSKYPLATQKGTVPVSPMHFREFQGQLSDDGSDPVIISKSGLFEHPLILRVLGVYFSYVDSIPEGIARLEEKPFGALELAIQAVERALVFLHSGNPLSREELADKKNHFSYTNWGSKPVLDWTGKTTDKFRYNEFRSTIRSLPDAKWRTIVAGARELVIKKRAVRKKGSTKKDKPTEEDDELSDEDGDIIMSDPPIPAPENIAATVITGAANEKDPESNEVVDVAENMGDNEPGPEENERCGSGEESGSSCHGQGESDDGYSHDANAANDIESGEDDNGPEDSDDVAETVE
ncbi:hypothetical protein PM082_018605 [Marasmius tenuissimus]|nr:hypothetical protein PM082_018605 [Marasmius tenuissimus]